MLVKSLNREAHIENLMEAFDVLIKYKMKLNQTKCAFGVDSGMFWG